MASKLLATTHYPILYNANYMWWKSFADGQDASNLLENFHALFTPANF